MLVIFHSSLLNRINNALNNDSVPNNVLIVKIKSLFLGGIWRKLGAINTAANHPAARLIKRSETVSFTIAAIFITIRILLRGECVNEFYFAQKLQQHRPHILVPTSLHQPTFAFGYRWVFR